MAAFFCGGLIPVGPLSRRDAGAVAAGVAGARRATPPRAHDLAALASAAAGWTAGDLAAAVDAAAAAAPPGDPLSVDAAARALAAGPPPPTRRDLAAGLEFVRAAAAAARDAAAGV